MKIILKNNSFTTNENVSSTGSTLDYRNGYFVNFEVGRGDLTSQFNVSEFLNNPANAILANAFLNYVQHYYTQQQIADITNDNQKLSESFNLFYNQTILGLNLNTTTNSLFDSTISSSTISYLPNLYLSNELRDFQTKGGSTYINTADSYYVNVVLMQNHEIIANTPYELNATINDGFEIEKDVIYLSNALLSGTVVTDRKVILGAKKRELIQGFIDLNMDDSPFNNYSNSGLDFDVSTFSGLTVYEIDANIFGNVSNTESIFPIGTNNVLIGDNITFTFKTIDPLKSINGVFVDNLQVDYDRVDNLSKSIAGSFTFTSVTKNNSISVSFV